MKTGSIKELSNILKITDNNILNKFIIDYYNLRRDLEICNK